MEEGILVFIYTEPFVIYFIVSAVLFQTGYRTVEVLYDLVVVDSREAVTLRFYIEVTDLKILEIIF